jgi:ATP/maltotriose-dependent transcriptional regulator MalT
VAGKARWEAAMAYLDYAEMRVARGRRGDRRKATALVNEAGLLLAHLRLPSPVAPAQDLQPDGNRFALTSREIEVMVLVADGKRNHEIATALTVTTGTVNRHLQNIFAKMGVENRAQAVKEAMRDGILSGASQRHTASKRTVNCPASHPSTLPLD